MLVFGYDLSKAPWSMVAYIVASAIALVYGTNYVNSMNNIRGIVFGIGAFLVFLYFGIKWFGAPIVSTTSWPPQINMCPDYLTYISGFTSTSRESKAITGGCVDMLGVGTGLNPLSVVTSDTARALSGATATPTAANIFQYTSADLKGADKATLTEICARCQYLGITWEGVYDGDTCVGMASSAAKDAKLQRCLNSGV